MTVGLSGGSVETHDQTLIAMRGLLARNPHAAQAAGGRLVDRATRALTTHEGTRGRNEAAQLAAVALARDIALGTSDMPPPPRRHRSDPFAYPQEAIEYDILKGYVRLFQSVADELPDLAQLDPADAYVKARGVEGMRYAASHPNPDELLPGLDDAAYWEDRAREDLGLGERTELIGLFLGQEVRRIADEPSARLRSDEDWWDVCVATLLAEDPVTPTSALGVMVGLRQGEWEKTGEGSLFNHREGIRVYAGADPERGEPREVERHERLWALASRAVRFLRDGEQRAASHVGMGDPRMSDQADVDRRVADPPKRNPLRVELDRRHSGQDDLRHRERLLDGLQTCVDMNSPGKSADAVHAMWGESKFMTPEKWEKAGGDGGWREVWPVGNLSYSRMLAERMLEAALRVNRAGLDEELHSLEVAKTTLAPHYAECTELMKRVHGLFARLVGEGMDALDAVVHDLAALRREYEPEGAEFIAPPDRGVFVGSRWDIGRYFEWLMDMVRNFDEASRTSRLLVVDLIRAHCLTSEATPDEAHNLADLMFARGLLHSARDGRAVVRGNEQRFIDDSPGAGAALWREIRHWLPGQPEFGTLGHLVRGTGSTGSRAPSSSTRDGRARDVGDTIDLEGGEASARSETPAGARGLEGHSIPRWIRVGTGWEVVWNGQRTILPATNGMEMLRKLLGSPNKPVAADVLSPGGATAGTPYAGHDEDSRAYLEAAAKDLKDQIVAARTLGDSAEVERLLEELQAVTAEVTQAPKPNRSRRRLRSVEANRARARVASAIDVALNAVAEALPDLHQHLIESLRDKSGMKPCYAPKQDPGWLLSGS